MKQHDYSGHLDDLRTISLAGRLFHVGSRLRRQLKPLFSVDFSNVKSFTIDKDNPKQNQWIPVLECAFDCTDDIDIYGLFNVNFTKSQGQFLEEFITWDQSRED